MPSKRFSLTHMARVIVTIGWSDFVLKYRGSILGYLWSFLAPLAKFLVILFVFERLFQIDIENYPLYLFLGIIMWDFFSSTTNGCMSMLQEKGEMIQKMSFPTILLIFAVGWTSLIIFFTHIFIYCLYMSFMGYSLPLNALYLPILILQMVLLFLGIGMLFSAYSLKYRDLPHLWDLALQVLFWLTPIAYHHLVLAPTSVEAVALFTSKTAFSLWGFFTIFVRFQPLSLLLFDFRRIILPGSLSSMPSLIHAGTLLAICLGIFVIGFLVFQKRSPHFVEEY